MRVEPTDESFQEAIRAAQADNYDAFVAVGGGSTIDTAKAANLYSCYPADLLDYVNPPIGKGLPVPGPLKTLLAIPTTAGTGSETTGVAIFDYVRMNAKTGIAHRRLKPTLGLVDPENTRTLPAECGRRFGPGRTEPRDRVVHRSAVYAAAAALIGRSCVRRIRARIRSATFGASRRCGSSAPTCGAPSRTRPMTKRAPP